MPSALSLSRQDAEITDLNLMQTSTSGAGLDKATTATDDLSTQLHEDLTQLSQATEAEGAHADGNTIDAAELQQPHPVAETMAPPAATAADQISDQIGLQQLISGAVAGNQPATTSEAPYLDPIQAHVDSSAASQASESSDSTVSSSEVPTAPATSNVGELEWLLYNPPTTPGGALLAAFRLWLMSRR